jgi:hypothetical protein
MVAFLSLNPPDDDFFIVEKILKEACQEYLGLYSKSSRFENLYDLMWEHVRENLYDYMESL